MTGSEPEANEVERNATGSAQRIGGAAQVQVSAGLEKNAPGCCVMEAETGEARRHHCPKYRPAGRSIGVGRRVFSWLLLPLVVLCSFAILFVGLDFLERQLLPQMTTGVRHALLTVRAGVVTVIISGMVFLLMRRQQLQLSRTAQRLTRLLASYQENPENPGRFENPHLVHCREVLSCERADCSMYDQPGTRCWQVMALRGNGATDAAMSIQDCLNCDVYKRSCPDSITELGEGLNNLMYLLSEGAGELGRMRTQVAEKQKMAAIGQIAAGVAHEVCNPLSSISSVVQMLKRDGLGTQHLDQLDLIQTHIQRISAVVRQLTKLARPGADRYQQIDIGQLLDEAVRLISFDPRGRKTQIVFERPDPRLLTFGILAHLQQVIINLALNALDAMPDGGRLAVQASENGGSIVVRVEDTGCGIRQEVGRRVFEPFYTTKEPGRGTGLGLAVTYGIVQKHGGTIDFAPRDGGGTVFTVRIPLLDKAPDSGHGADDGTSRR